MAKLLIPLTGMVLAALHAGGAAARAQAIPDAPPVPACSWDAGDTRSTCKFKDAIAGTPTSVSGNRVIVFRRSANGGHSDSRAYLDRAVTRLAARYGFTATISEDPSIFTPETLATAKVVIMSNGDGDVLPSGGYRTALEDFQQVHGWGVIWVHAACAFITKGWPFGQNSCVQTYYHMNPGGTQRRMFIDSGTVAGPSQGRRNPETEFLLRKLPGWDGYASPPMTDEWYCFRAPARETPGVNVLFGYDRGSGFPGVGCPDPADITESASQNHGMVWTRRMGQGITLFNSWGHNESVYTGNGNMGDSLLWRFIRYAAKDWCAGGSGEPGCEATVRIRAAEAAPESRYLRGDGSVSLPLPGAGRYTVTFAEVGGRIVAARSARGPGNLSVPGLRRGLYLVRIATVGRTWSSRVMVL